MTMILHSRKHPQARKTTRHADYDTLTSRIDQIHFPRTDSPRDGHAGSC